MSSTIQENLRRLVKARVAQGAAGYPSDMQGSAPRAVFLGQAEILSSGSARIAASGNAHRAPLGPSSRLDGNHSCGYLRCRWPGAPREAWLRLFGVTQAYVNDVPRQRFLTITVENAGKFARDFDCSVEDLLSPRESLRLNLRDAPARGVFPSRCLRIPVRRFRR